MPATGDYHRDGKLLASIATSSSAVVFCCTLQGTVGCGSEFANEGSCGLLGTPYAHKEATTGIVAGLE